MQRADYFNEAIITAMLAGAAGGGAPSADVPRLKDGEDGDNDLTRAQTLHGRLVSLLDEAVRHAIEDGLPREYAETADFAVCAFLDEILLSSAWPGRLEWMSNPLQLSRHDTATAGEDFYSLLDRLLEKGEKSMPAVAMPLSVQQNAQREENTEQRSLKTVLEIFALCLVQGFTGMLFDDAAAINAKLAKIGRFVPLLGLGRERKPGAEFFPLVRADAAARKNSFAGLLRHDFLDWLLWLTPPLAAGLIYYLYDLRLNALLEAFTKGNGLP
jgi:hypothetical protein